MGACCSCQIGVEDVDGYPVGDKREIHGGSGVSHGDYGARVRVKGSSKYTSMFSQQGTKGNNQDAMTVWENFGGHKDATFCAVFDGHGPSGHKVAQNVRDNLPSKLSSMLKHTLVSQIKYDRSDDLSSINSGEHVHNVHHHDPIYKSVKQSILQSFKGMDEDLEIDDVIDSFCSGTTAVTVLKKGRHLLVANLGDSRAVLCTRDDKNQISPVQLTVDLKPNLPGECERITKCNGRVFAREKESSVFRVWMPDQDSPGLAMARAFGDFCLKDFGVISVPEIYYRKLTSKDEFLVLATDGIWDVLSNEEVIQIVSSASKRSIAARLLVAHAVRAWRYKFPKAKIDDCAVVCLFFKRERPYLTKSMSTKSEISLNDSKLGPNPEPVDSATEDGLETVLDCEMPTRRDPNTHHYLATIYEENHASAEAHQDGLIHRRPRDFIAKQQV
ncbi:PPM-type phosphatase domain-containing protein [Heracleum sosnowskyi]|uniref:PPM-type phosphatase domain-containing protein n=1 Tax=Heracleum sosnowskyi TaxID=360622 RepID=A0AAD8J5U8_9APIA|nr:PPM-type phosphatase domain-containing protein [Heracleum sosnowskyi]